MNSIAKSMGVSSFRNIREGGSSANIFLYLANDEGKTCLNSIKYNLNNIVTLCSIKEEFYLVV